jgi:hypothetical protein
MRVLDALASVAGRISLGVAMAGSVAAGLWYGHEGDPDPVRILAIVTASGAWLVAEISSGRKPSEHDMTLFKRIVELLPDETTDFIRNHDFGQSFNGQHQSGLSQIGAWEGTRYQFLDRGLQKRWAAVHTQLKVFNAALVSSTGPVGGGPLFSAHPEHGDRDNPEPWVKKHIDTLNTEAGKLSKQVDIFEKYARDRLRL